MLAKFNRIAQNTPGIDPFTDELDKLIPLSTIAKMGGYQDQDDDSAVAQMRRDQKTARQKQLKVEREQKQQDRDDALAAHESRIAAQTLQIESDDFYRDILPILLRLEDPDTPDIVEIG